MHASGRILLTFVGLALAAPDLLAQERRAAIVIKGGATVENSEDGLTGSVPALGATVSIALTRTWRGEVEFWLPGYLKDQRGDPKHRDVLLSVSAVRLFRAGATRPFVTGGLSFSRTQDWFTFCTAERPPVTGGSPIRTLVSCDEPDVIERRRERNDGADGYLLVGGGVEIPIRSRVSLIADLRVALAPVSVLVRPGVGVAIEF